MPNSLKRTPLYDLHLAMGARLVEFGGWEMPVQYQGIVAEHQAVRSHVGNLARLQPGQAQYTVLLNHEGGIIDDVIFYFHVGGRWSVIVNAATTTKDKTWIESNIADRLVDSSEQKLLIAVQGKEAIAALQPFASANLNEMKRFSHIETEILGKSSFVARTGYTGEDGCEIMLDIEPGRELWQKLSDAGVAPCGLGCRDTLRLEAGMHLYGQDMDDTTTPLEADLGWLVHLKEKADFIGRSQLEAQKAADLPRRLVALEMEGRNIARHDYPILHEGETVGIVTSGTMSPTLGKAIALGYVPPHLASIGQALQVKIRDRAFSAQVVKRPFYKPTS
jgi:aminomethyltransferase